MDSFKVLSDSEVQFRVDNEVFSNRVIAKVLYWLSGNFIISSVQDGKFTLVKLRSKETIYDWSYVEAKISELFCDYAMREVIIDETKDIRNILYIKAFSNIEDYTEYDISED